MIPRKELEAFLAQLRKTKNFYFVDRSKNRETFWRMGMTLQDQKDLIQSLTLADYWQGPLTDDDLKRDGKLWVFKKCYQGYRLYIKVRIDERRDTVFVLSCHFDDH